MALSCGIVGLPNVGKSTIFNALTNAGAAVENFPFCTIEPNQGVVFVEDPRLTEISRRVEPERTIPAMVEFTDIAGLVKGAAKGDGLGNKFLSHIRATAAIVHVVRCFEDDNIVHVDGSVDPVRDTSVIDTELILADLETVLKRRRALEKEKKRNPKGVASKLLVVERVHRTLEKGGTVRALGLDKEEGALIQDLHLITQKPVLYVGNIEEDCAQNPEENLNFVKLHELATKEGSGCVAICGKIEAEISELEDSGKAEFLESLGLKEAGLARLTRKAYELLGLQTYFTAGKQEVRAWTIHKGDTAPQAAGVIHSDFERGFIKAEVYHVEDLMEHGTEIQLKSKGLLRIEGKEYIVQDGDIMHFRFNV